MKIIDNYGLLEKNKNRKYTIRELKEIEEIKEEYNCTNDCALYCFLYDEMKMRVASEDLKDEKEVQEWLETLPAGYWNV